MNPKQYLGDDYNPILEKTAQQIWNKDAYKKHLCDSVEIKLIVIWESDWKKNQETEKELLRKLIL